MSEAAIKYIIQFLIGSDAPEEILSRIAYNSVENCCHNKKILILPSGFFNKNIFNTEKSLPTLPLKEIDGVPLLFGTPEIKRKDDTIIVHADIIASAFFLLSRYEETVRPDVRDCHGRFVGKQSLPARAGFIDRPIVDEYGRLLRKWLREIGIHLPEPTPKFSKIYLTHDVDEPFFCRTWRNVAREVMKGNINQIFHFFKKWNIYNDPYFTFPAILDADRNAADDKTEIILFFKSGGKDRRDKPHYNLQSKDLQTLTKLMHNSGATAGLHASVSAGQNPNLICKEKERLENQLNQPITANRHHFLASLNPADMEALESAGITDDFTMTYADVAGFRLGTARPVRFINPVTMRVSNLLLHPTTIMDSTLLEQKYMNLPLEDAKTYCFNLLNKIKESGGEAILLWHNSSFAKAPNYHNELYNSLLEFLKND